MSAPQQSPPVKNTSGVSAQLFSAVVTGLLCVLLLMGNYLAFRHYARFDWTRQSVFSLSDKTRKVLAELNAPIDVYVFLSRAESNYTDVKELLDRYHALSSKLTIRYVDPDRDPGEYRVLAQRFALQAALIQETGNVGSDVAAVVVRPSDNKKWTVNRWDLRDIESDEHDDSGASAKVSVKAEQAFTGAIVQVTSGRATKVCVAKGHGEWGTESGTDRSLQALKDEVQRDNVEMVEVNTFGGRAIDRSCDALFIVGPRMPYTEQETRAIREFVNRGGNLLMALDPILENEAVRPTGLEPLAAEYGARVGMDVVFERDAEHLIPQRSNEMFVVSDFGEHATVRPLREIEARIAVQMSRSVRPADGASATLLATTTSQGFAKTSLADVRQGEPAMAGPQDVTGTLALGVASQHGAATPGPEDDPDRARAQRGKRVVVLGSSSYFDPNLLGQPVLANDAFATSIIGWLTERNALVSIPPKKIDARPMVISEADLFPGMFVRVLVLMPMAILILGFAVWWSRRT